MERDAADAGILAALRRRIRAAMLSEWETRVSAFLADTAQRCRDEPGVETADGVLLRHGAGLCKNMEHQTRSR
jgi:hypothetical protein